MTDEQKHFPWNEGQPTKPDSDALLKAFPVETMVPGWQATDEQIKSVIGKAEGVRYRTIYSAWIRRLQADHNINVFREHTVGFYVPNAEQVFARTHPTLRHVGRAVKKQTRHIAIAKPTNEVEKVTQEHQGRLLHNIGREAKKARMNVLPSSTPTVAVPKLKPPKSAS